MKFKYAGYFRLSVCNSLTGEVTRDTGWFPNLITNQGLDWFGGGAPNFNTSVGIPLATHCGVGLSSTAPTFADTQLNSFLAMYPSTTGSNVQSSTDTYVAGPPAYWSSVKTYSFAVGAVVGNIAEVGVGNTAQFDTQPQLFNHALILDGSGNPTTISVTASDALTVTYELRRYIDLTDNPYSVSINGVTYSGIYRGSEIASPQPLFLQIDTSGGGTFRYLDVYNGTIGSLTGIPSGSHAGSYLATATAYTPGTYFKSFQNSLTTAQGNVSGGITALTYWVSIGKWQFSVSPAIPKDNTKTMTLNWNVSWARYP